MAVQYRWADQVAVSSYKKETVYGTFFPTYTATNYHTLQEATLAISYDDEVRTSGPGSGVEFGTAQYLTRKDVRMTLTIDNLRPHDAGWLSAYALGAVDETQDVGKVAYQHTCTFIGTAAQPSFTVLAEEAGEQNVYPGMVIASLTISSDQGGYIQAVAELVGCGFRQTKTEALPATITETPFRSNDTRIWANKIVDTAIQTFATIDGTCTLVVGTASEVLTDITYGGWTVTINNNLRTDQGYQVTANAATDNWCRGACDHGAQREVIIALSGVAMEDDDWEDFLLGTAGTEGVSEPMAVEINTWAEDDGTIDSDAGTFYHQLAIYCPRMALDPMGASSDNDGIITRDLTFKMLSPTTSAESSIIPLTIEVLCAATAFMA